MNKNFLWIGLGAIALSVVSYSIGSAMNQPIPTLTDGKQIIASVNGKDVTAEDFFTSLKNQLGRTALLNQIDEYIANKEVETDATATTYVENQIAQYKSYATSQGTTWTNFLSSNGFDSETTLYNYLLLNYKKSEIAKEFISKDLTEKEINDYYASDIYGEVTTKHILIIPDTKTTDTDTVKTAAKAKALETAKSIITKLNSGSDFNALVKEYSEDTGTKGNDGIFKFTYANESNVDAAYLSASKALTTGKYTTTPVESQFGYHVILKVSVADKPTLATVKTDITDALVEKKISANTSLIEKTWVTIRTSYKFVINDTNINGLYNTYKASLK